MSNTGFCFWYFKFNDKFRIIINKFNIKKWFNKWIKKDNKFPFDLYFFQNPNNPFQLVYYLDSLNLNLKFGSINKKRDEFVFFWKEVSRWKNIFVFFLNQLK